MKLVWTNALFLLCRALSTLIEYYNLSERILSVCELVLVYVWEVKSRLQSVLF